MDIQNTFSDIRDCFLDIQNNNFGYPKTGINVNSACHILLLRPPKGGSEKLLRCFTIKTDILSIKVCYKGPFCQNIQTKRLYCP